MPTRTPGARPDVEATAHEGLLGRGQEAEGPRPGEDLPVDAEPQRRLVVGRGHERGALGGRLESPVGRRVEVGEEDDRRETVLLRPERLDQPRRVRALPPQELDLLVAGALPDVERLRERVEGGEVALLLDREAEHVDAAEPRRPLGQLVAPAHVVARAGGEHGDAVIHGQALRHRARERLGAPGDALAVALDDERDLGRRGGRPAHGDSSCERSAARTPAGSNAARRRS